MAGFIIVGVLLVLAFICIGMYNGLVSKRNKVKNSWSQVEVQLKRRSDLIPNLVETVKGYAAHEKGTLEEVTAARTKFINASSQKELLSANEELSKCLGRLFAVSEAYPQLKANENFIDLQRELAKTEDKIAFSRQFYNDVVMDLNNAVQMFPSNIFASVFGFREAEFVQTEEIERKAPEVRF